MPRTKFYNVNTILSCIFAFVEQVCKITDFGIHVAISFEAFWHTFSIFFRHRLLDASLDVLFWLLMKKYSKTEPFSFPGFILLAPRGAPKTHPRRNLDFSLILDRCWAPFWWYFDDLVDFLFHFGIHVGLMLGAFWHPCSSPFRAKFVDVTRFNRLYTSISHPLCPPTAAQSSPKSLPIHSFLPRQASP